LLLETWPQRLKLRSNVTPHQPEGRSWMTRIKDARVHCVVLNIRSAPALPHHNGRFTLARRRTRRPNPHHHSRDSRKPGPSGPNNVHQPTAPPSTRPNPASRAYWGRKHHSQLHCQCSTHELPVGHVRSETGAWTSNQPPLMGDQHWPDAP